MRRRVHRACSFFAVVVVAGAMTACASSTSAGRSAARTAAATTMPRHFGAHIESETVVDPAFRQGLARYDDGWIFSLDDRLIRTDDAYQQTAVLDPAIPAKWKDRGFDHIGDVDVSGGVLYVPLEQDHYEIGEQAMLTYDPATLKYRTGVKVQQHHDAFVTVDDTTGVAYSMDAFGGSALLRYDTRHDWKALPPLRMSQHVDRVQGGDVQNGAVWLSTDDAKNGIYRVDQHTGAVQYVGSGGHVDGEGEGIDASPTTSGDLHVLSMDAKAVPARVVALSVTGRPATPRQ